VVSLSAENRCYWWTGVILASTQPLMRIATSNSLHHIFGTKHQNNAFSITKSITAKKIKNFHHPSKLIAPTKPEQRKLTTTIPIKATVTKPHIEYTFLLSPRIVVSALSTGLQARGNGNDSLIRRADPANQHHFRHRLCGPACPAPLGRLGLDRPGRCQPVMPCSGRVGDPGRREVKVWLVSCFRA